MKLVLLSGGSGKRLWPLSNDARSKQFLKVLENENKEMESMVQRVWGQICAVGLDQSTVIATGKQQLDILQSQLGQVPIIVEPERRDTFPAIALAAAYLYSLKQVDLNETVCILPVDPYVEDRFFERIQDLEGVLDRTDAKIALMGVTPTLPSSKYGYIVPEQGTGDDSHSRVARFTEKPSEEKAKSLIAEGALWNCGVFAFKLGYLIGLLLERGVPIQYEELQRSYDKLAKISFDYEVVEKESDIVVIPYDGYWKDLGTWNTLTDNMGASVIGNGILSEDSANTHLVNELDIPVTIIGIQNAIVAVSPDGILVSEKNASPRIKDMVVPNQRPMYEERTWGWYRVLDYSKSPDSEVLTKRICLKAGKHLNYHYHSERTDTMTVVSGEGELVLSEELYILKPGDVFRIPAGSYHALRAATDMEFIEIQQGESVKEDDEIDLYGTWEEMEFHCLSRGIPS
ncbi:mannose-1-phosphate guanylyltransferase (GDP) /mannose-6-phosphate isomerase, type 2 [Cohnella sp. OV330]|uniref:sugar phosphate nucleotidyltransferase n=1 Tax=Cohnella sp. OV330 TaxID=1855288 RepID=UPI0008F4367B|nr:sugar phosphate nucleotidyltransferase [Cohnella sp. OV330]SFB53543.1 mannose-1-phosphate guanylyltransferase (GDP) /mannose-6-phosphate isomerase, type 2 [Cohnella sp. OV330]